MNNWILALVFAIAVAVFVWLQGGGQEDAGVPIIQKLISDQALKPSSSSEASNASQPRHLPEGMVTTEPDPAEAMVISEPDPADAMVITKPGPISTMKSGDNHLSPAGVNK